MIKNHIPVDQSAKKSKKSSVEQQVAEFMDNLEHPLKEEIGEVRKIILSANKQINEHIKWNAPSFQVGNEDRITFNLHGKGFFRLIFHCGAKKKDAIGQGYLFDDTTGILEWVAGDRAIVKFTDMNDVKAKEKKLTEVITKWIEVTIS
ncbi:DUF1801 domain-containing protein [Bacillus sp. FJAT-49736]|uniref:DUF1801 domain-containing protein n=1 Tax=Bacillus sp. FJAT-49736 TaxID=2833582 RepID=UPI001BC9A804|nr:DUF1801 domain-containing protein [Bacillus sp. FJAT-49736]MBS4172776.1 DUF1801 domain-containing protein [Bacillus sp. FJAT-49736]